MQSFLEENEIFSFTSGSEGSSLVGATSYLEATHPLYVYPDCAKEARELLEKEFTAWRDRGESSDDFEDGDEDEEAAPNTGPEAPSMAVQGRKRLLWRGALLLWGTSLVAHAGMVVGLATPKDFSEWLFVLTGLVIPLILLRFAWLRWGRATT